MTEFVNRVKTHEAREALVQTVSFHRELVKGYSKKELDKVQKIVRKKEFHVIVFQYSFFVCKFKDY